MASGIAPESSSAVCDADRADEHAAERQRAELGAVAGGVVEREARGRAATPARARGSACAASTFLTPWATPPSVKPANATHSTPPAAAPAMPRPWIGDRGERGDGQRAGRDAAGERRRRRTTMPTAQQVPSTPNAASPAPSTSLT